MLGAFRALTMKRGGSCWRLAVEEQRDKIHASPLGCRLGGESREARHSPGEPEPRDSRGTGPGPPLALATAAPGLPRGGM